MAITTSRVRLGCASSAGMLASAEKTCNTEPSFGDLRRDVRVGRQLDDVPVLGNAVHHFRRGAATVR